MPRTRRPHACRARVAPLAHPQPPSLPQRVHRAARSCGPTITGVCRLMCHCVRHIEVDNKHGRSVKAIHSFLSHILPPAGTQNALGESHKKASTQQAARRTGVLARCRRAHCARFERWRSQKHRWWPSAGVSGGGRDLTLRADDHSQPNPHQPNPTKARFSSAGTPTAPGAGRPYARCSPDQA